MGAARLAAVLIGSLVVSIGATAAGAPASHPARRAADSGPPLPNVLLVGDSVADTLQGALGAQAAAQGITFSARVRPGCGLITGIPAYPDGRLIPWGPTCTDGTVSYLNDAIQATHPQLVLWLSSWETSDRVIDGHFYAFGTPDADAAILGKFEETRRILTAGGAHLVMLTMAPRAAHSDTGPADNPDEDAHYLHLDELLRRFADQQPDSVSVVDLNPIVCPKGPPCPETVGGVRLRPNDGAHFAGDGPAWVAPRLLNAIVRELRPAPHATFR